MNATYQVEVNRYFVETKEVNKKGKPKRIPVTVRKLFLSGDFITTNKYRVVMVKRGGQVSFSISYWPKPKFELWPMLKLRPEPELDWKRDCSMNEPQFILWLSSIFKERTGAIMDEFENAQPLLEAA